MLPENELLQYVYKTADMGCAGIEAVLDYAKGAPLKKLLSDQLSEYQSLRGEAEALLGQRGEKAGGAGAVAKMASDMMTAGKLLADRSDSKIAEMTIQGNDMGVNKTLKHLHDYAGQDVQVRGLTEKLLATEERNARELKPFL